MSLNIDPLYYIFTYGVSLSSRNICKNTNVAFWKSLSTNSYVNIFNDDNNYEIINKNKHLLNVKDYIICKLCIQNSINIGIITSDFSQIQLNKLFKLCVMCNDFFMTKKLSENYYTYSDKRLQKLIKKAVVCNNYTACKLLMTNCDSNLNKKMFLLACEYKSLDVINILDVNKKIVIKYILRIINCGYSVFIKVCDKYKITKHDLIKSNDDILCDIMISIQNNLKFIKYIHEELGFSKIDLIDNTDDFFESAVISKNLELVKYLHLVLGDDCCDLSIESIENTSDEIIKYMFEHKIICKRDINSIKNKCIKKKINNLLFIK